MLTPNVGCVYITFFPLNFDIVFRWKRTNKMRHMYDTHYYTDNVWNAKLKCFIASAWCHPKRTPYFGFSNVSFWFLFRRTFIWALLFSMLYIYLHVSSKISRTNFNHRKLCLLLPHQPFDIRTYVLAGLFVLA